MQLSMRLLAALAITSVLAKKGMAEARAYDEQMDNHLRSVLFQIPASGNPECFDDPSLPACFKGVVDLGAIDIERGRDHGMPSYNDMRRAFGLPAKTSAQSTAAERSSLLSSPTVGYRRGSHSYRRPDRSRTRWR